MATKNASSSSRKKSNTAKTKKTTVKKSSPKTAAVETTFSTVTTVKTASATKSEHTLFGFSLLRSTPLLGAVIAEFIGTFLLTAVFLGTKGEPLYLLFTLTGITLLISAVSGAHVNPAITFGALITRKINFKRALAYFAAQILGAVIAFLTFSALIVPQQATLDSVTGAQQQATGVFQAAALQGHEWKILFAELIGTIILSLAVATALRNRKDRLASAFTAGLGLFLGLVVAVYGATLALGASSILNPAVALALGVIHWGGSAAASNVWSISVYLIVPLIGGALGFIIQDLLRSTNEED